MRIASSLTGILAATLMAGAAFAADYRAAPLPPPPPPPGNWAGSYIGGHAGYLWGDITVVDTTIPATINESVDGFVGGILGGHNWQSGVWVFGIDLDAGWSNAHGTGTVTAPPPPPNEYDIDWNAHIRGRIGAEVMPGVMVFGAAGVAFTHFKFTEGGGGPAPGGTFTGATAGLGAEMMWSRNFIVRAEWLHDFRGGTKIYEAGEYEVTLNHVDTVRGALIYKFR
ncbi:MAG: outer membrane beta-barrel protein [Bauldia sp.]